MGVHLALRPLHLGPETWAQEGEVVDVSEYDHNVTEKMILAGDLIYVPSKGEEYSGPHPLHPWAAYGVPEELTLEGPRVGTSDADPEAPTEPVVVKQAPAKKARAKQAPAKPKT